MNNYKKEFIDFLIESEALLFGEFTTKSGRQSPYFINTGKFRTGEQIKVLGNFYAQNIINQINERQIDRDIKCLFGPAYKGIPLVIATSIALSNHGIDINYCFNRKEVKDHGEGGNLVGYTLEPDDKVLIIEDVITAGTAVREILPALRNKNVHIEGLMVSVDRMEKAQGEETAIASLYKDENIPTYPIINLLDIIDELYLNSDKSTYKLNEEQHEQILAYMDKYCIK
jgi:orotate phosphoribosyltransferase